MIGENKKSVAIFGAGIAGLTAAHEFSKFNYNITVYDSNDESGGFFRSARRPEDNQMPSEYSWHGIGPWYHNVFDVLKQIPTKNGNSLYECGLSRPIDFGMAPDKGIAQFDEPKDFVVDVKRMFRMNLKDKIFWAWILFKVWCARKRSEEHYSTINAKDAWKAFMSDQSANTWGACFGPWVGSDYCHVSLHQAGHFFRKQLVTKPRYWHKEDNDGEGWSHGARSGWLLLNGPSSEVWFDQWVSYLKERGVDFKWGSPLTVLHAGEKYIEKAVVNDTLVMADIYVLATNPFSANEIIEKSIRLKADPQLQMFKNLVKDGPHNQVSFRIAFKEKIYWPRKRCALVIADSAFNLTLFAQEQVWSASIGLGHGVASLWTGTACVSKVAGSLHGIALENCTKEQFIDEVIHELTASQSLDQLIKEANHGRSWRTFEIERIEVWHEWKFSKDGISCKQPKWVNSTNTQKFMPTQKTSLENLVLAGAHTKTDVDVWSIEGAVESGRRAVKVFEKNVVIKEQYRPLLFKILWAMDDALYALKLPNIVDVLLGSAVFILIFFIIRGLLV